MAPTIIAQSDDWINLFRAIEFEGLDIPKLLALRMAHERGDLTEECEYQPDTDVWGYYRSLPSVS